MEQRSLFDDDLSQPLAARLRPETLEEFVGQRHLLGKNRVLPVSYTHLTLPTMRTV